MKTFLSILICLGFFSMKAQTISIPDPIFLNRLIEVGVDTNGDGVIQQSEAEAISSLSVSTSVPDPNKIQSLEGIQYFVNLTSLHCQFICQWKYFRCKAINN